MADAFNNLTDAGSSVITLIGFRMSGQKPDKHHPFGHGRIEYFAGLTVSAIIVVVAVELFISSVKKIAGREIVDYSSDKLLIITICVLGVSILVKLWMALFNKKIAKNNVEVRHLVLQAWYYEYNKKRR